MILGVGVGLIPPLLIREIIDVAIPQHQIRLILILGCGLVLFPVGSALLGMGHNYLSIVIAQVIIADLRERLYRHLQSLGLDFFTWTRAGEIHTRFLNDAGGLQNVLTQSFLGTFANLITLVGTLAIMFIIPWRGDPRIHACGRKRLCQHGVWGQPVACRGKLVVCDSTSLALLSSLSTFGSPKKKSSV